MTQTPQRKSLIGTGVRAASLASLAARAQGMNTPKKLEIRPVTGLRSRIPGLMSSAAK